MKRHRLVLLVGIVLLVARAQADLPPPNGSQCAEKVVGAPCTRDDGTRGLCRTSTCSRHDYSHGIPPRVVSEPCLKCEPATADAGLPGRTPDAGTRPLSR